MKRILGLIAVVTLALLLVACGGKKEFDFNKGTLVVGMEADYAPFNWLETKSNEYNHPLDGRPGNFVAGYDVSMAKLIAEELELELVIKAMAWEALPNALSSGMIDVIIAGMSPTEDRKENILFSNAYYAVNHVVVAKESGALTNMTKLEELKGHKGIGQANTVYDELVNLTVERYGAVRLNPLDSTPLIANAVSTNVAQFMIVEKPVALGVLLKNPDLKIAFETDENVFDLTEGDRSLSVGMTKINTTLQSRINEALATITQDTRDTLMDQAVKRSADGN